MSKNSDRPSPNFHLDIVGMTRDVHGNFGEGRSIFTWSVFECPIFFFSNRHQMLYQPSSPNSTHAWLKQWFWKCDVVTTFNSRHYFSCRARAATYHIFWCEAHISALVHPIVLSFAVCFVQNVFETAGRCITNSSVRDVGGCLVFFSFLWIKVHFTDINKHLTNGLFYFIFYGTTLASGHWLSFLPSGLLRG